jgi:2-polyprenyl-3-methyl-5-hydroxy-6-metoxy-1,4-benzoquinol methylase
MIQRDKCPLCRSADFSKWMNAKDYTVSEEQFGICHCNHCNLRFTNPVPSQEEMGPYYKSEEYVSHTNTSKGIIHGLYQRVRKITLKRKRSLVLRVTGKSVGSLLDIGSGVGAFLAAMKVAGWDSLGLEPDETARAVARSDFRVDSRPIHELFGLPEGAYDAVTMWHVLEHVHELDRYMEQLRALVKEGGKILIAVPNHESWDARYYQQEWAAYDVPRHLYHFCPKSMEELLKRHSLRLIGTKRMPFDSFYVSMLTERNCRGSLLLGVWNGWRSWWVALFHKKRCSSLIYIIEK